MTLRYEKLGGLTRGHVDGVSAIAFSCRGTYIISAGVKDCTVYVWRVRDQKLLHKLTSSTTVLSLQWLPEREDAFLCGLQGGSISSVMIRPATLHVHGFWAHDHPVEHLSLRGTMLASGAKSEVAIWQSQGDDWNRVKEIPKPPTSSFNKDSEILVTGVHWTKSNSHPSLLLVAYMFHGISIYETDTWRTIRHVPLQGPIAHTSVSPDDTTIAISNMVSGFDLYDLDLQAPFRSFAHPVATLRAVPVLFVHGGQAVLGGSTVGKVHLWNVSTRLVHKIFRLGATNVVMALAANYNPVDDRYLIATGIANGGSPASVVIWIARDAGRRRVMRQSCRLPCFVFLIGGIVVFHIMVVCAYYHGMWV